jgi:hypothetical protein
MLYVDRRVCKQLQYVQLSIATLDQEVGQNISTVLQYLRSQSRELKEKVP